jgi:hypothetical protein
MMIFSGLGKILIVAGVMLVVVGLIISLGGRFGLGQLPGDLAWRRGNTSVYFPVVTSIVVSVVLTILLNLFFRFFR